MNRFRLWLAQLFCGPALSDMQAQLYGVAQRSDAQYAVLQDLQQTLSALATELNDLRDQQSGQSAENPNLPIPIRRAKTWREFAAIASQSRQGESNAVNR